MKPYAHYHPETDSMMIALAEPPDGTESEEVAENIIAIFDKDNRLVALEIVGGAKQIFAEFLAKVSQPPPRSKVKAS